MNLKYLSDRLSAVKNARAYQNLKLLHEIESSIPKEEFKQSLGLKRMPSSDFFKEATLEDSKIYPNYFAPVITLNGSQREIQPMRYRIRPQGSENEIPTKFNVFNARLDSLETRKTWRSPFMKRHGLVAFKGFYEWVEKDSKKSLIRFSPNNSDIMWAPCLWEEWTSKNGLISFKSFAIITDEPPSEIESLGHDRCPIFLNEDAINEWLNPNRNNKKRIYDLLSQKQETHYDHSWPNQA